MLENVTGPSKMHDDLFNLSQAEILLEYPRTVIIQFYASYNYSSDDEHYFLRHSFERLIHPLRLPCIHLERYQSDSVVDIISPGYNGETF